MKTRVIIVVCANCGKMRNREGDWLAVPLETADNSAVDYSHTTCPECTEALYPQWKEALRKLP